jgi:hypothetical protein
MSQAIIAPAVFLPAAGHNDRSDFVYVRLTLVAGHKKCPGSILQPGHLMIDYVYAF